MWGEDTEGFPNKNKKNNSKQNGSTNERLVLKWVSPQALRLFCAERGVIVLLERAQEEETKEHLRKSGTRRQTDYREKEKDERPQAGQGQERPYCKYEGPQAGQGQECPYCKPAIAKRLSHHPSPRAIGSVCFHAHCGLSRTSSCFAPGPQRRFHR